MSELYREFTFDGADDHAPRAILSLINAGDMKYSSDFESEARLAFFKTLSIDPERVAGIELRHSRNVALVDSLEELSTLMSSNPAGFDGIVTRNRRLVPSVTVADCMPIWIYCSHCGAFGILHSGWKGTGILAEAAHAMERAYGCKPGDMHIILGPAIGACCYRVERERAGLFSGEFGSEAVRVEQNDRGEAFFLDMRAANLHIARRLGIRNVTNIDACTACSERYGSYRRQGSHHFTRMLALCISRE